MNAIERVDQLWSDPNATTALRTEPSRNSARRVRARPASRLWFRPFWVKLEFRAITKNQRMRESAVMITSTIPSVKYFYSGSHIRRNWRSAVSEAASEGADPDAAASIQA
jgi:hypothetical protein